jgi:hypothetical protein
MNVRPEGIDHNTEAIGRPCEHGNSYFGCTKIRNIFPYCAIFSKGTQLVEAQRHNPEGRGFDFRWVIGIFHSLNPSVRTMAVGSTQSLTEMRTRCVSWGVKAAGV